MLPAPSCCHERSYRGDIAIDLADRGSAGWPSGKLGIEGAALNQSTSKEDAKRIEAQARSVYMVLLFVLLYIHTLRKLAKSKRLMNKLEKSAEVGALKVFAIDEVHCCSQWGHDFRPDYKFLNILKRQSQCRRWLGLTGNGNPPNVSVCVKNMLDIPNAVVFKAGFNRLNLHYEVVQKPDGDVTAELARLIKTRFANQSGIVYCFSRKDCEEVAAQLREAGIRAAFYHADMDSSRRTAVHEKWVSGKYNVIVATVAFGMGIDKPDVRYVIHHALPKSVENYFQESGRAGRDGLPAVCILYFRLSDVFRSKHNGVHRTYRKKPMTVVQIALLVPNLLSFVTKQKLGSKLIIEASLCHALLERVSKTRFSLHAVCDSQVSFFTDYIVAGPKGDRAQQTQIMMKCKQSDCDVTVKVAKKRKLDVVADEDFIVLE
ncbi:ATP-dependent DNA helicase, RecQ family [Cooperia oncophora]